MSDQTDLAWLAGLIDGEGCLTFEIHKIYLRRGPFPKINLAFYLAVSPGLWQNKVTAIFIEYGIAYHQWINQRNKIVRISVTSTKSVKILCNLIKDYSVIKKELVQRFLNYEGIGSGRRGTESKVKQIAEDLDYVRSFNRKKNIPYIWDGRKIMESFGFQKNSEQTVKGHA